MNNCMNQTPNTWLKHPECACGGHHDVILGMDDVHVHECAVSMRVTGVVAYRVMTTVLDHPMRLNQSDRSGQPAWMDACAYSHDQQRSHSLMFNHASLPSRIT